VSADAFLFHKTSRRALYDAALAEARAHGADEPLLANERGEVTEGARTNLIVELDGARFTPALDCGLLPGIARARLLASGRVRERVLRREDLHRATRLWLVNSLRGCIPAVWVNAHPGSQAPAPAA
jgi:branched-subunit amino acid aminotransferase/4-amino-4-deoxychorismate lyase